MKIISVFVLLLSVYAFPQSEKMKWGKSNYTYSIESMEFGRDYSINFENSVNAVAKSFINAYWFLISDLDGDNCPFYPSCSAFFVDAVEETNIVTGTLMFFDRFTRDASVIGRQNRYPKHKSGRLYDPANLYCPGSAAYIPPLIVIDKE
ncbi:MAG TPA: membrane protein insertion efficiency factor YidD [Ignavibacteriaceae bacterium]|nr:membrane protein insertion efficiency factor YidD [Ignavibacteriaceae bacterium]